MFIKRYTIAAFILMLIVGWYVYAYVTQDTLALDMFGVVLPSVSIALLVVIPLVLLYIASVGHMTFYSMLGNFKLRRQEKDYEKVLDSIRDAYLGKKDRKYSYKTPSFSLLGKLLDNSTIFPNDNITFNFDNEQTQKITLILDLIKDIKNGEVVNLKPYGLAKDNELVIQNSRNMYKKGDLSAEDILSNTDKYGEALGREIYVDYVKSASLSAITKYKTYLTKESLMLILERINAEENTLDVSNETVKELLSIVTLSEADYMNIAKLVAAHMIPEQRIKLFEMLSNDSEDAMNAYLYTLFDLEMLAPAYAILDIAQPNEYENFKAYRALKECNKNFNIELFV